MATDTQTKFEDLILLYLTLIFFILCVTSIVCIIIHICKFIRSKAQQSLTMKILTLYFVILLLYYFNYFVLSNCTYKKPYCDLYPILMTDEEDLNLTTKILKFIMAVDIFLCFRKTTLYLKESTLYQNRKFAIYCLAGLLIPFIYVISIKTLFFSEEQKEIFYWTELGVPILRLIPILGSIWYITMGSNNKVALWKNFPLQMRLLILIGGFASTSDLITLGLIGLRTGWPNWAFLAILGDGKYILKVTDYGIFAEGIIIAIAFTFRRNSFTPIQNSWASNSGLETQTIA